jgi:hypothetical protein
MFNRRSFKSDDSFLEKISIGAIGTRQVYENLRAQGHTPIELERGSMSFKIWKSIKIKRIRVPDILLLNSNQRVESRAKTKLEITMSHSFSNLERAWDSGLEDSDYVALVFVRRGGERPIDWVADDLVQYISVSDLRKAYRNNLVLREKPKGAQEGFEERVTWFASLASSRGIVQQVNNERIQYRRSEDNRTLSARLIKGGVPLSAQVAVGESVLENQIIASVVPIAQVFPVQHTATAENYIGQLRSSSQSERYTAAKALYYFDSSNVREALADKIQDDKDHIYVRLDAAASLSRNGDQRGYNFIQDCLSQPYVENQLEAVIVLGEIGTPQAVQILLSVLGNADYHPEIRAGAAWAIGELRDGTGLTALVESFNAVENIIRVEAARALAKLAETLTPEIIDMLPQSALAEKPGIAWALSQAGQFTIDQLTSILKDDDTRRWAAYMLGTQEHQRYINQIETLRLHDPEVYFAATVLWQIMSSWVYNLEMYG